MDTTALRDAARWPEPYDHHDLGMAAIKASASRRGCDGADAAFATDILMRQMTPNDLDEVRRYLTDIGIHPTTTTPTKGLHRE